jgi:hypothetical protein
VNIAGRRLSNGDAVVGIALIVALIAIFLPWYSATASFGGFNSSVSVGGLSYWAGWLYFIAVLAGLLLYVLRTFVPNVAMPALPQTDAILYIGTGVFMVVMAIFWLLLGSGTASASGPGFSAGASFGLFIGLIAAVAVAVGGYLKRSDAQPATRPLGSAGGGYGAPPPPPPAV